MSGPWPPNAGLDPVEPPRVSDHSTTARPDLEAERDELRTTLASIISHPRWLSIGGIDTDVEFRCRRAVYERAVVLSRAGNGHPQP